jgi:hypothetical protein
MSFTATQNKGFGVTFENGFTLSVQWGVMNYCEHRSTYFSDTDDKDLPDPMKNNRWESELAEIAVFGKDKLLNIAENDQVIGWVSADNVAKVIAIVSSSTTENEIETKIKSLNL